MNNKYALSCGILSTMTFSVHTPIIELVINRDLKQDQEMTYDQEEKAKRMRND